MWTMEILLPLILAGISAGFLAGLLGVGGGTVIVPIVLWLLAKQGISGAYTQHIALGTSFAIMVFTTFSSAWAQHRKRAIDWQIVRYLAPALVVGSGLGSLVSRYLPAVYLQIYFIVFLYVVSGQMLLRFKPKPSRQLPQPMGMMAVGNGIGLLSSWLGVGGGAMSVPFMTYCNVPIHVATGTSAALAWAMSASGLVGYMVSGWQVSGLPEHTFGFVYLPVVLILACCTMLFAPIGVRVAHGLSPAKLKMTMGGLLFFIGTQMLWNLLH